MSTENYRHRTESIDSFDFSVRDRSPTIHSDASDFSDTESNASTLSESILSAYWDRSFASSNSSFTTRTLGRDGRQSFADMTSRLPSLPNSPSPHPLDKQEEFSYENEKGPWSKTENFDVNEYLSRLSLTQVLDPSRTSDFPLNRQIILGKRDANGYIKPIPLFDCLGETSKLDSPNEPVFTVLPKKFIFKAMWPGYETYESNLLEDFMKEYERGAQLTREILVRLIAKKYNQFALYHGLQMGQLLYDDSPATPPHGSKIGPYEVDFYRMNIAYIQEEEDGVWFANHHEGLVVSLPIIREVESQMDEYDRYISNLHLYHSL